MGIDVELARLRDHADGTPGGKAEVVFQIEAYIRTLPDGKSQQPIVANGVAFDANGTLYINDTARGAVWQTTIGPDGRGGKPVMLAQNSLLEGADGLDFDRSGNMWVTANERIVIVMVSPDGKVQDVFKNGSQEPLEFPSAIVSVGNTAYISNNDTPRRGNLDANGTTARDGIGASIAQITL